MATTNFETGTVIEANWLNDVDDITYRKSAETVSVKDPLFGAVGDGVTDDTVAIQAAIDYIISINGGTLHFPYGTYKVTSTLYADGSAIRLEGDGSNKADVPTLSYPASTTIYYTGTGAVLVLGDTTATQNNGGVVIKNLKFKGTSSADYGIQTYYNNEFLFEDLSFTGFTKVGSICLELKDRVQIGVINRIGIFGCYNGILLNSRNNAVNIYNVNTYDNAGYGLTIGQIVNVAKSYNVNIIGCDIERNALGDIFIYGADNVNIQNSYFENETGVYAITLGDTTSNASSVICRGIKIDGCYFAAATPSNFAIKVSTNRFLGLVLSNNIYATFATSFVDNTGVSYTSTNTGTITAFNNNSVGTTPKLLQTETNDAGLLCKSSGNKLLFGGLAFLNENNSSSTILDWYEEGTFTPIIIGGTSAGTGTYTSQIGRFQRIGNRVTFRINIAWTAHTGTGALRVGGLPYTISASGASSVLNVAASNLTYTAGAYLTGLTSASDTYLTIQESVNGSSITSVAIDTSAQLYISGTYEV